MISEPIYKRDSLGNVRTWQFEVEGPMWRTIAGLADGQKVVSTFTQCTPKSQDTAEAQALFEAEAERRKKLERSYHERMEDLDTPNFFQPMLAQTYKGGMPAPLVYCQPKLDGIRCIASGKGLFSRQGKRIFGVPHIEEALDPIFEVFPDLVLDGEFYNHDLRDDFNTITSVVRRQKLKPSDIELSRSTIQYHIYDVPDTTSLFSQRFTPEASYAFELILTSPFLRSVPTIVAASVEEIQANYERFVADGYEGQMIRIDGYYEQKRSNLLLKHKSFVTDEFKLVDIQEGLGNWSGYGKRIVCELPDGRTFGAGVKGNQAFTKSLLEQRNHYIGGEVSVRYFALTPDGVPRFPVAVDFHPNGRQD